MNQYHSKQNQASHTLLTNETCGCDKNNDLNCPVCDWGLGICSICNAAEIQMEEWSCEDFKNLKDKDT